MSAESDVRASGHFSRRDVKPSACAANSAVRTSDDGEVSHSLAHSPDFNPKTCLALIALNGTYRLSNGTGAYAGIRGHGIYRVDVTAVAARNSAGKCTTRVPPVA